ncbi:MAG: glycosyltransferase family 4 protein [Lachnospira sp.]
MNLSEQNILFFTRTMKLGGTENVILQLCEIFKPLVNNIVVCSCGGVNVEKLNSMGIKHYDIPDIENKSPSTIYKVSKTVKDVVKRENITVIHTHHRMAAFYVSLLRLYKNRYFINTSHNTFSDKKSLTRYVYKHANMIACGEMVKKNLVNYFGFNDEKVTVIHNAVRSFDGAVVEEPLITELHKKGCFVVGNVGRLSKQKGMEYYIKSIPGVLKKHPEARFMVIGSGEDEEKLKELVCTLGLEDYIYFTGYRSDIQNIIEQLDLVVLSSLWEGLPLTPIEAFSVGKTIVATAVDGTVEIVEDGVNGVLVRAKDSEALTEGINSLISNDALRKEFEYNAKKQFDSKFSFNHLIKKYTTYYEGL